MLERRFVAQKEARAGIENRGDGKPPVITGYGSVFYDGSADTEYVMYEGMCERIMPSAFDRAVKEDDVRGLFNHDQNMLLGRTAAGTMRLSVDKTGLRYEIDPPDTQCGRDTQTSIKRGDLTGSSFAFIPTRTVWVEEDTRTIREIHDCQLFDTGPVTYPAYEGSSAGLRSANAAEVRKEYEAWKEQRAHVKAEQEAAERTKATLAQYAERAKAIDG